jgi:hypothetical protein
VNGRCAVSDSEPCCPRPDKSLRMCSSSQRVADLRHEIEHIRELNTIYLSRKRHLYQDTFAQERRQIRLEEIKQELDALRSKQTP